MTDEARAREILGDTIQDNGDLSNGAGSDWDLVGWWGGDRVLLDGNYTADQLEAIAWWMRNAPS